MLNKAERWGTRAHPRSGRARLTTLSAAGAVLLSFPIGVADGATLKVTSPAIPNASVKAQAHGLQPGAHISVAVAPARLRQDAGVVVGPVRVVPPNGRITVKFRWPRRYFDCRRHGGASCVLRSWRHRTRTVVALGAPDLRSKTSVNATARSRVVVRKRHRGHASLSPQARASAEVLPDATQCDSPWMSFARVSGQGYGARVSFVPTERGRNLARVIPGAYHYVWQDLERCVSLAGIPGDAQSSMKKQMVCHATYGVAPHELTGGSTWDLEAWYEDVGWPSAMEPWRLCHYPTSGAAARAFDGWIVQRSGDREPQRASWLVVRGRNGLVRNHIPTSAVYACLRGTGTRGPAELDSAYLNDVVPEVGDSANCSPLAPIDQHEPGPSPPQPNSGRPPAESPRKVIVVDNRVTDGMGMREDTTPARLGTQPWVRCISRGCAIYGTERSSGQTYDAAVCQTRGERTTNGHDSNASDDANPERYESTLYYGVRLGGTFGYVSETWIRADYRGGLGLPAC